VPREKEKKKRRGKSQRGEKKGESISILGKKKRKLCEENRGEKPFQGGGRERRGDESVPRKPLPFRSQGKREGGAVAEVVSHVPIFGR